MVLEKLHVSKSTKYVDNKFTTNNVLLTSTVICLSLDLNECNISSIPEKYIHLAHNCHVDANCTNTKGSYYCTCVKGYSGDGSGTCVGECILGGWNNIHLTRIIGSALVVCSIM